VFERININEANYANATVANSCLNEWQVFQAGQNKTEKIKTKTKTIIKHDTALTLTEKYLRIS